jgi:anti-sigma factor RsiW
MKECLDEGTLQSYFDGELSIDMMEKANAHLTACLMCKRAARELENEALILSEALEPEFSMAVPTERLRARVEAAIAERQLLNPPRPSLANEHSASLARRWWGGVAELFAVSPQRAFAYAGLAAVILFAITFALVQFRTRPEPIKEVIAQNNGQVSAPAPVPPAAGTSSTVNPKATSASPATSNNPAPRKATQSSFVALNNRPKAQPDTGVKLLPGERSYLKTIAALDTSLKSNRNRPMRPALQSEYERNLAMVDRAIAATRNAAKSNPNDPDAADFMFAAYQTKVDLLNQVAEARLPNRQQ